MTYLFAKHLLLRMPVKSPADYANDSQTFLSDHHFRAALYLATPSFYQTLEQQAFQEEKLTAKEQNTVRKYINRYCFRPTPFGLFASVTLLNWPVTSETITALSLFETHVSVAMTIQNLLNQYLLENELRDQSLLAANPSIYRLMNEYRFFRTGLDEQAKHRDYQLQSIAFSKLLKDLIAHCNKGCSRLEVIDLIVKSAACTPDEAADYTDFLIDSQLLVNLNRMSITGQDALIRLRDKLSDGAVKTSLINFLKCQKENKLLTSLTSIQQMENELRGLLINHRDSQDILNVILQRNAPNAVPDIKDQEHLRDGITALELLSPSGQSATMSQFIKGFQQHFEGQTLPLLQALDPEAGVGYQHSETEKNNLLLETLVIPYKRASSPAGTWSAVHSILMEAWLRERFNGAVIHLNDTDLEHLRTKNDPQPMLGMSVLFRVAEDKVFIENAGGINAPALMGRFTVADEQIAQAAQSMARQLELQNPDIIFAELLHLADPHTDNVNRRTHIYHYELPITAVSILPDSQQIQLSDLSVKVVNNLVVLFSEKHHKIVIPRLTSAYNHSLNKLPLFRFLADLPYQYARSSLNLDLRSLFPDLKFYPRVEYKKAILSLATWIIRAEQLSELQQKDPEQNAAAFSILSAAIDLPRFFSLAEGDQELVFDGQTPADINFFCSCISQKKEVVIKEFLKQPIIRQYNVYLLPAEPLILPQLNPRTIKTKVKRKYMPGSEWLYLKVYAPKIGVNRLLLKLSPVLKKRYGEHKISKWFFIRYEDHAPHIRLRLQVEPAAISEVLVAFKTKLEDRIQQHVIREFQIDVYTRELERYAAGGIENTEHFFWASSKLVLSFLKQGKDHTSTHAFALYSTYRIITIFIKGTDEQLLFTLGSFQQFLPEFGDKPFKVELDRKYRELTPEIVAVFGKADPGLLSGSAASGNKFLKSLKVISSTIDQTDQTDYLRSIIHLHLNRIFTDQSRKQEMISYYLLHKYLLSVKGRIKKNLHNAN